jgi:ElaB/YqjD/DUF883 family membrane-anchored ribosome-binding protein
MANSTTTMKEDIRSTAGQVQEQAKGFAGQAAEKAKDVASTVGQTISDTASTVGRKADDLTSSAGSGLRSLGETLQEKAPHEGMLGGASQAVASGLRESGRYIEQEGISGMLDDLTGMIRRYPFAAIGVGLCVGYCVGFMMRSRSR